MKNKSVKINVRIREPAEALKEALKNLRLLDKDKTTLVECHIVAAEDRVTELLQQDIYLTVHTCQMAAIHMQGVHMHIRELLARINIVELEFDKLKANYQLQVN